MAVRAIDVGELEQRLQRPLPVRDRRHGLTVARPEIPAVPVVDRVERVHHHRRERDVDGRSAAKARARSVSVCRRGTAPNVGNGHELPVLIDVKKDPPRADTPAPSCRLDALQPHEVTSKRILLHRLERREQAPLILSGRSFKRLTCGVGEDEIPGHSSGR